MLDERSGQHPAGEDARAIGLRETDIKLFRTFPYNMLWVYTLLALRQLMTPSDVTDARECYRLLSELDPDEEDRKDLRNELGYSALQSVLFAPPNWTPRTCLLPTFTLMPSHVTFWADVTIDDTTTSGPPLKVTALVLAASAWAT